MKLILHKNNSESVKVFIAFKLSGKSAETSFVDGNSIPDASVKKIPQLVLDSGVTIYSSNAICKYLLAGENSDLEDYWLEVEASVLQPRTAALTSKLEDTTKSSFESVLQSLNAAISSNKFISGKTIGVADVSLFATLYPLWVDPNLKELLKNKENILRWMNDIKTYPGVDDCIKQCELTNTALSNLAATHWFPPVLSKIVKVSSKDDSRATESSQDSPSKEPAVSEEECRTAKENWLMGVKARRSLKQEKKPVLPVPNERNILISSALPYVNNVPHLGNIIGCVLSADVFARFCRLRGYNTLYVCGTDEYGTATETKALEEGLTPKQICDKYFKIHEAVYKWFNIQFDIFGRTTTPEQTRICQDIFTKVNDNGYIASDSVEQLLCEKCDRFLADRFVEGICPTCSYEDARGDQCDGCGHLINATELKQPRCKLCQTAPVIRHSTQFFLDLPKIEPALKEWLESVCNTWSSNARVIARSWLRDGLKQRCITRDLKWGIPVPLDGYRNKVFYVWFDAPIGYISITNCYTDQWKKWWLPEKNTKVEYFNFVGKDNVPFHSVMFPASLLATNENYTIVQSIYATEYLNYEDGKFSKSRGVGVFGTDAQDTGIPADVWRFYLLYVRPESQDSNFSWLDLATKNNSELLNNLGNFINRALMFAEKNFNGQVPIMNLEDDDYLLIAQINREITSYLLALEKGRLRDGIRHILSISRLGNQLMQASQPWVLLKGNEQEKQRAGTIIGLCCNVSCLLCILLYPYMPGTADTLKQQMNVSKEVITIEEKFSLLLQPGHKLGKPSPLFTKIEISHIEKLKSQFSGRQRSKTPDGGDIKQKAAPVDANLTVEQLELAILEQGDVVRKLKSSGKEKSEWQPQVAILLELKKQLSLAQANTKESQKPEKEKTSKKETSKKTPPKETISNVPSKETSTKTPPKEIKKDTVQMNGDVKEEPKSTSEPVVPEPSMPQLNQNASQGPSKRSKKNKK